MPLRSAAPPPAAAPNQASPVLLQRSHNTSTGPDNSISAGGFLASDMAGLYRSVLHPQLMRSTGAANRTTLQRLVVVSSQPDAPPHPVHGRSGVDPDDPSGQLLLWYFLGLASVQPLVLWLQAAALAAVLNVLRHMPELQLQAMLSSCADCTTDADAGTAAAGDQQMQPGAEPGEGGSQGQQRPSVFLPLSYEWRAQWTLLDWLRFRLMKHSLDIVLVSNAGCLMAAAMQPEPLAAPAVGLQLIPHLRCLSYAMQRQPAD